MIWIIRQIPNREPKFHHDEILDGAGKSMNEWLIILSVQMSESWPCAFLCCFPCIDLVLFQCVSFCFI